MAHTDTHRPWCVQIADPHNRHLLRQYGTWRGAPLITSFRNLGCGCWMCTDHHGRRARRRQDRHRARRVLRLAVTQQAAHDLDEDLPLAFRPTAW